MAVNGAIVSGDHYGIILGPFWDHVWHHFGITLGSFLDHLGITLGSSWAQRRARCSLVVRGYTVNSSFLMRNHPINETTHLFRRLFVLHANTYPKTVRNQRGFFLFFPDFKIDSILIIFGVFAPFPGV